MSTKPARFAEPILFLSLTFFYGAMYISYAFSVALVITSLTAINVLVANPELWMYLTTTVVLNIILLPAMLRYSKVLYLYWLGKLKYRGF